MVETNKEYELRCFSSKLIEFIERLTDDDGLCDCPTFDKHEEDCSHVLVKLDIHKFQRELELIKAQRKGPLIEDEHERKN